MGIKKMALVFIPALLFLGLVLFIEILHYEPQFPKPKETANDFTIPILPDDPILGVKRAGKTVITFGDFSCSNCQVYHEVFKQLIAKHPTAVRIVWKGLPVTRFPYPSEPALLHGYCAASQGKFNEFSEIAFAHRDNLSDTSLATLVSTMNLDKEDLAACVASQEATQHLENNKAIANALNIQAVPIFFINDKQVEVSPTVEAWETALGFTTSTTP